ncbi:MULTISPECIES: PspC domain-containing protein [Persicobacter]|uniref:PspC domain-containing protein n=1 Tax=Persicobacter TaxID=59740 RepID=UPI00092FCAFE|nr:PspC domain-containing protein [Persicobacter sp. CCB-QB2]
MKKIQYFIEDYAFGVCTSIAQKMGISVFSVRLSFMYLSCLTAGSPLVLYLILAFWKNIRRNLRRHNNPIIYA